MSVTNVVQSIWILILYSLMTVFMPAVVMHKRIAKRRLCEKFLICGVAGKFYIINVVLYFSKMMNGKATGDFPILFSILL